MLLEEENKQLKDALINKKKKQQRSKALLLELAPKYNRGGPSSSYHKRFKKPKSVKLKRTVRQRHYNTKR